MTVQQRQAAHVDDCHAAFSTSAHWTPPPAILDEVEDAVEQILATLSARDLIRLEDTEVRAWI